MLSISTQFTSIWPIDRTLIKCYHQSGPGSDGNEGILRIPQSSSITGTSLSNCLVSYPGHSLGGSYTWTEKQSMYSTAPADWAAGHSLWVVLPLRRCSQCILQPQPNGKATVKKSEIKNGMKVHCFQRYGKNLIKFHINPWW